MESAGVVNCDFLYFIDLIFSSCCRHGLIMGCSVTGRKEASGASNFVLPPKSEDVKSPSNVLVNSIREWLRHLMLFQFYALISGWLWIRSFAWNYWRILLLSGTRVHVPEAFAFMATCSHLEGCSQETHVNWAKGFWKRVWAHSGCVTKFARCGVIQDVKMMFE